MDKYRRHIRWNKHKLSDFCKSQGELDLCKSQGEFLNYFVQFEGSRTAVTEVTGRDMIWGVGLCSTQGSVHHRGVKGSSHRVLWVHMVTHTHTHTHTHTYIYIYIYIYGTQPWRAPQFYVGWACAWRDPFHDQCECFKIRSCIPMCGTVSLETLELKWNFCHITWRWRNICTLRDSRKWQ
jgi:hypothetical protein